MSTSKILASVLLSAGMLVCAEDGWAQALPDSAAVRRFHAGLTTVGVQHLNVVGLGLFGVYGNWQRSMSAVNWGGELFLLHSGERRVQREDAYNKAFAQDSVLTYVYEQVSSISLGGSAFRVLHAPPEEFGPTLPGVALGFSAGVVLETDRVGLQTSDLEYYYGYSAPSNTDISFRPYVRPQIMLSQGPVSIVAGVAVFPVFASWSVGVAYGW